MLESDSSTSNGYYFEGVADIPIPDEQDNDTLGFTKNRWLKGEWVIGALIDFEHGDHDLGRVTRTFVRNHKGKEWLALGAQLKSDTKPELVNMIREWSKLSISDPEAARKQLKKLGLSLRYITTFDPVKKVKTGTRLQEVSFHRNAHHKDADILVCQGEHDRSEMHVSVPLADLVSGSTKRHRETGQHRQRQFSFPPLSEKTMATATTNNTAAPMEGVSNTTAAAPPAATPAAAAAPSSTSGLSIEMVKLMAELEREKQARMEAEQANKRYEEEKKVQEAERKAKEAAARAQQAEQKKNDFMALKEHFADIGIDMENEEIKRQYEAIFNDENASVFYNSQLTALKKLADSKKLLQEKEAKLVEYDKGLQELVNAKRLRPSELPQAHQQQQQPQQAAAKSTPSVNSQNLPRNAEQAQELAKNDPAIADLRARLMSRESGGISPASFGLVNGKPMFQWPALNRQNGARTGAPGSMSTGGAPVAVPVASVASGSVAIPVAQGAGATPVHTGDPIINALVGNTDEKIKRTAFAFQDADKGVLYSSNGRTIDLSKFNLPGHSLAGLGNAMLNMDCGWSYPTKNFDRDVDSMKRKTVLM